MFSDIGLFGLVLLVFFPAAMAFAASSDLFTMKISNWVSLALAGGFFVTAPFAGFGLQLFGQHLAIGALVLAVGFACFSFGWMGGADAKIAAAVALWFGWPATFDFLLIASVIGGGLTLALLTFRHVPLPAAVAGHDWLKRLHNAGNGAPYGIALAASALIVYPNTFWMSAIVR
ncbi:prepilin peptidase CpaA [Rhodobium orientis]|uniref:Peptidase n=1 Tax=Rhodobium orientis TaxID=34017 RepID=A0A327JQT8_9HYPH|nr:prepilin peptidase [Rhodobium orientis]MBB4304649.1 prepilin peptidase CpaA [Rhodobium orientis]MBK5950024.1 peptidase [Rhodobium orientis]RAI27753.1 peptidase [Rhodobium orientis]